MAHRLQRQRRGREREHRVAGGEPAVGRHHHREAQEHQPEGQQLADVEVGGLPLEDQRLLGGRALGLERIEVDPRAVGVDHHHREAGGGHPDELAHPGPGRRPGDAEAPGDPLRGEDQDDEGGADDEAGVEVAPHQEEGHEGPDQPPAPAEVALDEEQHQAGEREGDHLGARPPDGVAGDRREEQAEGDGGVVRPRQPGSLDQEHEAEPGDHGQHDDDEGEPTGAVEECEEDLGEPLVHHPPVTHGGVGVRVGAEQGVAVEDELPGAQVPPEVRIADRAGDRQRRDQQGGGEQETSGGAQRPRPPARRLPGVSTRQTGSTRWCAAGSRRTRGRSRRAAAPRSGRGSPGGG